MMDRDTFDMCGRSFAILQWIASWLACPILALVKLLVYSGSARARSRGRLPYVFFIVFLYTTLIRTDTHRTIIMVPQGVSNNQNHMRFQYHVIHVKVYVQLPFLQKYS